MASASMTGNFVRKIPIVKGLANLIQMYVNSATQDSFLDNLEFVAFWILFVKNIIFRMGNVQTVIQDMHSQKTVNASKDQLTTQASKPPRIHIARSLQVEFALNVPQDILFQKIQETPTKYVNN